LKEKTSWKDWALVTVAFGGALFVVKPTFSSTASLPAFIGVLGGLGAGLAYTFVRYLGKKGERNAFIVFFFSGISCLIMLPPAILQYVPMAFSQVLWLVLAGVAASCAQLSVTAAYTYAPAKDISVYDYSQVLFTALWGGLFLSQFPDFWSVLGYVIIISAAIVKYILSRKNNEKIINKSEK
jgi:drug/metabolite transporter (DMT)-like permease